MIYFGFIFDKCIECCDGVCVIIGMYYFEEFLERWFESFRFVIENGILVVVELCFFGGWVNVLYCYLCCF